LQPLQPKIEAAMQHEHSWADNVFEVLNTASIPVKHICLHWVSLTGASAVSLKQRSDTAGQPALNLLD
jgi:hypothetical protein